MVVTRSGMNTNIYEPRTARCGHQCCTLLFKCCACEDTRPVQAHYVAHNRSNLFEVSYVSRSHYYCLVCKQKPSPVKIDFSKMKRKPASDPALFQPTTEYKLAETEKKLAEAEKKLAETEKKLAETNESITRIVERLSNPFKSAISRPNF